MTAQIINATKPYTVIFYEEQSLELKHDYINFSCPNNSQRIILSTKYKQNKTILAVCDGHITFLNKLGDRVFTDVRIVS